MLEVNLLFDTILVTSGYGFIGSCFILQQMEQHPDIRLFNLDALTILLTQNFATGCTMLVERSVSERALPIRKEAIVHDWWLALVAASYGHVFYAATSTIRHMHRVGVAIVYAGVRSVVRLLRQRIRQRSAFSTAEWISCVN